MANKITGAYAGRRRQSAMRTHWARRVAQFHLGVMCIERATLVTFFAGALQSLGLCDSAAENLVVNGSFESQAVVGVTTLQPGATNLTGWTIGGTRSIYLVKNTNSLDGAQFVDLNGINGSVTLSQAFPTEVGNTYDLWFSVGRYQDLGSVFTVEAAILDSGSIILTNREVVVPQSLGWDSPTRIRFIATTPTTTLRFANTNGKSNVDLMLDAVSVRQVTPYLSIATSPLRLCWQTESNYVYQIQRMSPTDVAVWDDFGGPVSGLGDTNCAVLPDNDSLGLFRVLVLP